MATVYGMAVSSADFFVPPPPHTSADIEVADRMAIGQSKTVVIAAAGKKALILFDGSAGQRISLSLSAVTVAGGTVSIIAPNGNEFAWSSISTGGSFVDAAVLPSTGTYTIFINPSGTSGSVTLTLNAIQDATATLTIGGPAVTVTTTVPGQNARLTFSGTAGQRISLNVTAISSTLSCPSFSIVKPDGTSLTGPAGSCASAYFIDATALPATGRYTVVMDPSATKIGSATFALFDVSQDAAAGITPGGPAVTMTTSVPGQNGRLTFSGTAGQRISLNVTAISSTLNCPSFSIVKPDGTNLIAPVSVCASSYFIDATELPVTGSYTVVMDPRAANIGSSTFALFDVSQYAAAGIAPGGPAVTVTTTAPGQNAGLTFSGTAGQRISLNVTAISSTLSCPLFSIVKPDGTNLIAPISNCASSYFLDVTVLPVTGSYTIVMDPRAANVGSGTFALFNIPQDATAVITPGGPAITMTTTVPGQNAKLTFSGTAGQRISLNVTAISSTLSCPTFSIVKPDGTNLIVQDSCASSYFLDVTVLPVSGTYTVVMNPKATNTGSATFALIDVPQDATASLPVGGPAVTLTTTLPGQNAKLTFSGAAGQRISLNVTAISSTLSCPVFSIVKPDGTNLVAPDYNCASSYFFDVTVLPVTGSYTVVMDPKAANTGSATFALFDVPQDATASLTIGGPAVTMTTTVPGQNAKLTFSGAAGQRISLNVTAISSSLSCPVFSIVKPDGTNLIAPNYNCASSYFIDVTVLPVAGSYTVVMDPKAANIGSATFTLFDVPADATGNIGIGGPAMVVTTTVPGQNASVTFSGTAGQQVTARVTGSTLGCHTTSLRKPDGSVLVSTSSCTASLNLAPQVLPLAGTYVIRTDPSGPNIGHASVAVTSP